MFVMAVTIFLTVMNLNDFYILNIKGIDYRVYITNVEKKAAVYILNNSNLNNK